MTDHRLAPVAHRLLGLACGLALLLLPLLSPVARADHGHWEETQVWIDPVTEERTRVIPGYWDQQRVWIPPRTVTEVITVMTPMLVDYQVYVPSGHWSNEQVWVESYEIDCRPVWQWYQDCDWFGNCQWVYGPREECERIDTSHWVTEQTWVDTSHWETRTSLQNVPVEQTVERVIAGYHTTHQVWVESRTETYSYEVSPGYWDTQSSWIAGEHPVGEPGEPETVPTATVQPTPTVQPEQCRPSGIYKVVNNYSGTEQWTDEHGTIHYETTTSTAPNPWWAVRLGSVSKGSSSRYDGEAFNGRGRGSDGLLLAGWFYRNYLPDGDCFRAANVVFFQDDTVVAGELDTVPTETPTPESVPTETPVDTPPDDSAPTDPEVVSPIGPNPPTITPTPTTGPTVTPDRPAPAPTNSPQNPTTYPDPAGDFDFAVVVEGSGHLPGAGGDQIEILRGSPVAIYLLPRLSAPPEDPAAVITFTGWSYRQGPNDHPEAPPPGAEFSPLQPLPLRLDDRPSGGLTAHRIDLLANLRVTYGDGMVRTSQMPVALHVTVAWQVIA